MDVQNDHFTLTTTSGECGMFQDFREVRGIARLGKEIGEAKEIGPK